MIKIGITGSMSSGKSTVSNFLGKRNIPIFSADAEVNKIYKNKYFLKKIKKFFVFKNSLNIKTQVKKKIKDDHKKLEILEKVIHPLVRKKMVLFLKTRKHAKFCICEIPLLIENKLNKYFDYVIFVDAKKSIRLNRYIKKGGIKKIFLALNKRQLSRKKKILKSNYVINNNSSLKELKKNVKILFNSL